MNSAGLLNHLYEIRDHYSKMNNAPGSPPLAGAAIEIALPRVPIFGIWRTDSADADANASIPDRAGFSFRDYRRSKSLTN